MKILIYFLLLIVFCNQVHSQIQIIDTRTECAIPFVNVISNTGTILCVSDINGYIYPQKVNNIHDRDIVEIAHISYKKTKIKWKKLVGNKTLKLKENTIKLNDITVQAKKNNKDYLILKGYFRSYQLDEHLLKAYSDGIVEYYVPLRANNKRLKIKLIENRTFRNPKIYKSNSITGDRTGPPYIEKQTILNELSSYNIIDSTDFTCKVMSQLDTIGIITVDTIHKDIRVDVNIISPERAYSRSFLKNTVKYINFSVSEHFSSQLSEWNRKSNLLSRIEYRKQLCSHKKLQKKPVLVESFHEFYVIKKKYISKKEVKKRNLSAFFGYQITNYSTQYWKNLQFYGIPEPPDYIKNLLGKTLEIY